MSVKNISSESVLTAVRTARFPPSTADLATYFSVIPSSPTLRMVIEALVAADRLVVANPGSPDEPTWAVA